MWRRHQFHHVYKRIDQMIWMIKRAKKQILIQKN